MTSADGSLPLVTIITPSLNQGAFIEDALASVRAQTHVNIEHLVIDGGSTDGTLEALRRRESESLRWVSEPDGGMYEAINKGLEMAHGAIVGYLNCDDVYPPWAVAIAVHALQAHPSAVAVFGDGLSIDQGIAGEPQRLSLLPPVDARRLAFAGSLVQPAVFWRRQAGDGLEQFNSSLRYVGDLDYWLRLATAGSFIRVDEVLAIERLHPGALSSAAKERMSAEDDAMRRRHHGHAGWRMAIEVLMARARAAWWRRILFLRLLAAARRSAAKTPWGHFLAEGVEISPGRAALSLIPRFGARYAWDAVRSRRTWLGAVDVPAARAEWDAQS